MGSEWPRKPVSEICELIVDCVNKTAPKIDHETPFKMIRTTNVRNGRIDLTDCKYVSKETYEKWTRRAEVLKGDVLLTREAPIGEVGRIEIDDTIFLGQRLMQYRADSKVLDSRFLLYSFLSPYLQHQFNMHEGSGSVVSHIKVPDCSKFEIPLPPLYEQKAIAHVLGSLDDRIELNRRMNETLESMAQALFKSWFVDFDPVIDNALASGKEIPEELSEKAQARAALGDKRRPLPEEIRILFPDQFIYSEELGWIPRKWEEKQIGDLLELAYGKSLPAKKREPGLYPVYGSGGIGGYHKEAIVVGPGIIVGRKGTVGSVYWENGDFFPIDTVFFVKPKTDLPMYWFYQNLNSMDIASLGADSAIPGVNRNAVYFKKWIVPNTVVLEKYWNMLYDLVEKRQILVRHNEILEELRDTLLPKLLSGELRIPDAEKMVEELAL